MDRYLYWFVTQTPLVKGAYTASFIVVLLSFCGLLSWAFATLLMQLTQ